MSTNIKIGLLMFIAACFALDVADIKLDCNNDLCIPIGVIETDSSFFFFYRIDYKREGTILGIANIDLQNVLISVSLYSQPHDNIPLSVVKSEDNIALLSLVRSPLYGASITFFDEKGIFVNEKRIKREPEIIYESIAITEDNRFLLVGIKSEIYSNQSSLIVNEFNPNITKSIKLQGEYKLREADDILVNSIENTQDNNYIIALTGIRYHSESWSEVVEYNLATNNFKTVLFHEKPNLIYIYKVVSYENRVFLIGSIKKETETDTWLYYYDSENDSAISDLSFDLCEREFPVDMFVISDSSVFIAINCTNGDTKKAIIATVNLGKGTIDAKNLEIESEGDLFLDRVLNIGNGSIMIFGRNKTEEKTEFIIEKMELQP